MSSGSPTSSSGSSEEEEQVTIAYSTPLSTGIVASSESVKDGAMIEFGCPLSIVEAEPLTVIAARVESSGAASTSEPTGILTKNPASRLNEELLTELKYMYNIPDAIEVRPPSPKERIDFRAPGWMGFYARPFRDGFRFPIPRLVRELLNHFEVAPSQLMPNTWRILMSVECMCFNLGLRFGLGDLLHTYYLKEHIKEKGRYLLYLRPRRQQLVLGLMTNDRGDWQKYYFFARGEAIFGSAGAGDIPSHWENSSEWFSFVVWLFYFNLS